MRLRIFLLLFGILSITACSNPKPHFDVLRGNYAYGQGHYQQATERYLSVLEYAEYQEWVFYDLGNVYHSLGESGAALEMWEKAAQSEEIDILFGVSFNRGVLFYEMGRYEEAYEQFKYALQLNSTSMDAKLNLELSYGKIKGGKSPLSAGTHDGDTGKQGSASGGKGEIPPGKISDESRRILDYVRKKEGQRWFATEELEPDEYRRNW
ncbi:MAG: tetratricopeptide repeat protein [Spirochaetia bacterium]